MAKKKPRCLFPIKAVRNIFPNAKVGLAKHYASHSEWNRKNFTYVYGGVDEKDYPEENKILQKELKEWAVCKGLAKRK